MSSDGWQTGKSSLPALAVPALVLLSSDGWQTGEGSFIGILCPLGLLHDCVAAWSLHG